MNTLSPRRHLLGLVAVAALAIFTGPPSRSQTQINRPIRLIVPYVPGGGTDTLARLIGPYIGEEFGQQVVVENRPGGGSTIGTLAVAKAAPDGLTMGMIDAAFVTNPSLVAKLPYDTLRDFVPVVLLATSPLVMVINPALPVKTVKEFVAYVKAHPGQTSFGSAGQGTGVHLAAEQFRTQAGLDMIHIPYKGTGQAITELIGGQTTTLFTIQTAAKPMIDAGRLRALAITSSQRTTVMPDVATFVESGFAGVDAVTINGLVAPAGTPPDYVRRVNAAVNRAIRTRALQDKMVEQGFNLAGGTPEEFAAWLRTEIPKWNKVVKDAGLKTE
jgi:tripartite-type tricarboxylate transporter receptor subunit TctC